MTDREKKQREIADLIEIGIKGYASGGLLDKDAYLDIADKVIKALDAIPVSKEAEEAVRIIQKLLVRGYSRKSIGRFIKK